MFSKKIKFILIILLLYQTPLYSKSTSFNDYDSKILSKYFSGMVAFENRDNSKALDFFNSTKIMINQHNPYLKKYIMSLVLEKKIIQAINLIKQNKGKSNSNFFNAYLLLIIDSLKKNDFDQAKIYLSDTLNYAQQDKFNLAILETLKQYIYVFKEKKILNNKKNFGQLSVISETFQRCYLSDPKTGEFFLKLINNKEADFTRYTYFYLTYLIENNSIKKAEEITVNIKFINTTLLLSQGKSWIDNKNSKKLISVFSCKNHNDIISEFLFLISNLYSTQNDIEKSNFYLNLSNFLNSKFVYNLSLTAENHFSNKEYKKAKKILRKFKKEDDLYYWYRLKKEAQIIAKERNKKESLNYITSNFDNIKQPNKRMILDIANFYKDSKKYEKAAKYYSEIINSLNKDPQIKSDLLYRRGGSYERLGNYEDADKDLLNSLKINPNDAYVLNYLAYSWLERDYKINEAIEMLETAYALKSNDPYIIDSIGWAHYMVQDYLKAEKFMRRAVELMPEDPIVNDHYGDILWKLNRKIQARYFWENVLRMEDAEQKMLDKINTKIIDGLKDS